jgi:hypothetical protein
VYIWDGETGWVEDGEEVSGGMMEGIGIPTSQSRSFIPIPWVADVQEQISPRTNCISHQTVHH